MKSPLNLGSFRAATEADTHGISQMMPEYQNIDIQHIMF